jgi:hypothetical protein
LLQGETSVGLGSLLPALETLKGRVEKTKPKLDICLPLADAVLAGVKIPENNTNFLIM